MSKERIIKYLRHPAFTAASLTTRNPFLQIGEIVFELDGSNKSKKYKVGPGLWNTLSYFNDDLFTLTTPITNPIGDASGVLLGQSSRAILEKILNPYQAPAISGLVNNAGGSFANIRTLEIGTTLSGNVTINYSASNIGSLIGATPVNITAGNIFSNEGNFANSGSAVLSLVTALNPANVSNYNIGVRLTHTGGQTAQILTSFRFYPKIIWGNTSVISPTSSDVNALTQKQISISNIFKRDYTFNGVGYCVVAIPSMLNPTTMTFTDVTDPNAPAGFSMENLGSLTINNGVGTYSYTILRSTYYITAPTSILRIS